MLVPEGGATSNPSSTTRRGPANDAIGSERTSNGQEHDLPVVRQGRRGCCPLLRRDLSRERGGCDPSCTQRLPFRQEGRRADGGIHSRRRLLSRPQRRSYVQA